MFFFPLTPSLSPSPVTVLSWSSISDRIESVSPVTATGCVFCRYSAGIRLVRYVIYYKKSMLQCPVLRCSLIYKVSILWRGIQAFQFWSTILNYGFGMMAWTCTHNLKEVLGPCAQCCPCEALEQKMGQKPTAKWKEITRCFKHHSICFDELIILVVSNVKIGCKMAELWPFKVEAKVASWPILGWKLAIFFEIWTSN